MRPIPSLAALRLATVAAMPVAGAALPVSAEVPAEGRCWVAIRVTGPEAMRVDAHEADDRIRSQCREGDVLVFLTDTGRPFGPFIGRYCDVSKALLVERVRDDIAALPDDPSTAAAAGMLTCIYRGEPRPDR